jgi:uncharacterized protein YndB with AHSA1/START domain
MTLQITRTSPTTLTITRHFAAPPARVWAAHTDPALLRQWMGGYDGWTMTVCDVDLRLGGTFRYAFLETATGYSFAITGTYDVIEAPHRMVHIEIMHMPDPTPEDRVETRFDAEGTGTLITMTMTVVDAATMEAMIATGMTDGMEVSYKRLETLQFTAG